MEKITTVIFDMDGVIFDSEKIWKEAYRYANKKFGINISEKQRQEFCGMKWHDQIDILKERYNFENAEKYVEFVRLYGMFTRNKIIPIKKGFVSLVEFLKSRNIKIGLATGSSLARVNMLFKSQNLVYQDIFQAVATQEDVKKSKPNPEIYNLVLKKLKTKPENCIVLEDSINGINASLNAGINTIMVKDLIAPNKKFKQSCLKIFKNLCQVQRYLEKQIAQN